MNEKLIKLNGTVIKKSICDTLGIYSRHVKVKLFHRQCYSNNYISRWNVYIDGVELLMWWGIQNDTAFAPLEKIIEATKIFCSEIKEHQIRKFVDGKPITLEVKEILSKLNFEYKLDLLN